MNFLSKPRSWVVAAVAVAGLVLLQQFWQWEVERVEVGTGQYLVRIHLWGKDLPEGEILAPDESYKGVMNEELPEGRYFLNPFAWAFTRAASTRASSSRTSSPTSSMPSTSSTDRTRCGRAA